MKEALLCLWVGVEGDEGGPPARDTDQFNRSIMGLSPRSINVTQLGSSFFPFSKRDLWVKVRLENRDVTIAAVHKSLCYLLISCPSLSFPWGRNLLPFGFLT